VPFGVTVRELVGKRGLSLLGCHIMNDESVVFGLSQKTPEQRKAAYWLCGLGVAIIWPLGALLGAMVGKLLPDRKPSGWMRYSRPFCWRWWFPRLKTVPR
jgi:predicted branched-subunit amino acid permease